MVRTFPILLLSALFTTACSPDIEGDEPGECTDGGDNDQDGDFDCDDSDCHASPDCVTTDEPIPTTTTTTSTTGTTTGTNTATNCDYDVVDTFPSNGAGDVYYRTTIELTFDPLMGGEAIRVSENGTGLPGTNTVVDNTVIFTPSTPLSAGTTYEVGLASCPSEDVASWTTGDLGAPASNNQLIGNTYALDVGGGRFIDPPGLGPLLGGLLDSETLIGVSGTSGNQLSMLGGFSDGGNAQDLCAPTFALSNTDFAQNPYFVVQTPGITATWDGLPIPIQDYELTGAFAADASYIGGATFRGTIDMDDLADVLGGDGCDLLLTFGVQCQTCTTGSDACMHLFIDTMEAPLLNGVSLTPVTANDIANNPSCN